MVGPPPPPPPPLPGPKLPSSWRKTEDAPRRHNNPAPPAPGTTRPNMDAQALQHAASRLRKTQHGESIRSDVEDLPNGRLDRENQPVPGRNWPNSAELKPVDLHPTRESIPSASPYSVYSGPLGDVYRCPDSLIGRPSHTYYFESNQHSPSSSSSPSASSFLPRSSLYETHIQQLRRSPPPVALDKNQNHHFVQSSTYHQEPLIRDARSRIHDYATNTFVEPVPPPPPSDSQLYSSIKKPARPVDRTELFVKSLRDEGLTPSQKYANQFQKPQRTVDDGPIAPLVQNTSNRGSDEIDLLMKKMQVDLQQSKDPRKVCVSCGEELSSSRPGCTALDSVYHVACFVCKKCGSQLAGASFYNVDGAPICEKDYQATLERCSKCGQPIADKLLRAVGGAFHVQCFTCVVCNEQLDGVPFTVDSENKVHCVPCFHQAFAPRCAICSQPIVPNEGEKESVRVVAMDKSYHVQCYKCEDCGLQLSSKIEGQGCYPIDSHLYCKTCNGNRLRVMAS